MVPNIDPEQVRKLAGWGLTQNDILPWHRRSSYEPDAPARGVPQSPRWRVGLVCAKDAKLSCRGNSKASDSNRSLTNRRPSNQRSVFRLNDYFVILETPWPWIALIREINPGRPSRCHSTRVA